VAVHPWEREILKMRFAIISITALAALLSTGAMMNRECKSNRGLWWCAPPRAHLSIVPRLAPTGL
jgi:hypothetical protein